MASRKALKIFLVAGARPNFMKVAPLMRELRAKPQVKVFLVHTGQHYDERMSEWFFRDLGIPKPDTNLEVGSGTHAWQTAEIMKRFEPVVLEEQPDVVVVVGDVNSTVACSLVAAKLHVPVAHVEAGLRSFDRTMPEEINRILTDALSDYLFTIDRISVQNLLNEGIPRKKIFMVGDVMIDTLRDYRQKALQNDITDKLGLPDEFALLTLHRPSNVDEKETLKRILRVITDLAREIPIVFPVHPRTAKRIGEFGLTKMLQQGRGLLPVEPLGYVDFLGLMLRAKMVLTDSGSIQQESFAAGIRCITLRYNTERPYTLADGRNVLVGNDPKRIRRAFRRALRAKPLKPRMPRKRASKLIVELLLQKLGR